MLRKISNNFLNKLQIDILWNIASFGIIGISGIVLNILIGIYYNAATLGVFNQVYAIYIFFSQFAAGGIHFSTLKYIAEYQSDRKKCEIIITSSITLSIILALFFSLVFFLVRDFFGFLLTSNGVAIGIMWAAPGLFFFALNKVLLSILNAFRYMKLYAFLQALRYLLIILSLVIGIIISIPGDTLSVIFFPSEGFIFLILLIYIKKYFTIKINNDFFKWIYIHLKFGIKSFLSGVLLELNTRVDVLMLGYFLSDKIVGIYSFAAMIAEGILQFLVVFRTNYNPILVKYISSGNIETLKNIIRKGKFITYFIMLIITLLAIFTYPYVVDIITGKKIFVESWSVFIILILGIFISSGYFPFGQIILQAGYPGLYTIMISILIMANIIMNFLFIPIWGMIGAAFATGLSFIFSAILIIILTRKKLGIYM